METQRATTVTDNHQLRTDLFNKLIVPELDYVKRIVKLYTYNKNNLDDYYVEVLENFFKYMHTYNPEKPLRTWIHIVVRRFIQESVRKQSLAITDDVSIESVKDEFADEEYGEYGHLDASNYHELVGDDMLEALESLKPIHKEAFLLQASGFSLSEITEILYANGKLKTKNLETVKSRVFLAKTELKKKITRDGTKRQAC